MASPIGVSGSSDVKVDEQGSTITVHISEPDGLSAENLSLSTWGASFVLANNLHKVSLPHVPSSHPPNVLELGAGTALVGLSAAAIWRANVTLTDLPAIVPGLVTNASLNRTLLREKNASAAAGSLDWTEPDKIRFSDSKEVQAGLASKYQVILAADTIYDEDHPRLLTNTITTWLAPGPDSRVILCYPLRMAYIDHVRDFWERMEAAGLECCEEGKAAGTEEWNEVSHTPYEWCIWRWKMETKPV